MCASKLDQAFGPVRLVIDKIRELETWGQLYNFSTYLENAIIICKTKDFPILAEVYIPEFPYYFQFIIDKDPKTLQIYVSDFRIVSPNATFENIEEEFEDES